MKLATKKSKSERNPTKGGVKTIRSFTLVEMLLSSVIVVIILGAITMFFLNIVVGKQQYLIRQELAYNSQFVTRHVTAALRAAQGVNEGASTFGSHPGTLSVIMSEAGENPTIISSSGSDLTLQRGSGPTLSLITNKVTVANLIFNFATPNNTPGIVTGTVTLQSTNDTSIQRTETFSVNLRSSN
ncbi:MAG: hypothetical protein Q8P95_01810 [bacterium]|nr:hypothetical protein [bacterium]